MLVQLEQECLEVYRRKVDQSNHARARLHEALAEAETELNSLFSALGERPLLARVCVLSPHLQNIWLTLTCFVTEHSNGQTQILVHCLHL